MSSRSIKTAKGQSPLDSLPPEMRAEAEARAAARANATPNEAIKVDKKEPTEVTPKATPGLLGAGAAANALRGIRGRQQDALDQ